jgi:hypothetical protein
MNPIVYFDTSALAKWYISEPGSAEVEKYIRQHGPVSISDLTIVEMRCLLARRRRDGSLTGDIDARVWATLNEDLRNNHLICHALPDKWAEACVNLVSILSDIPLRSLDAIHLVVAEGIRADTIATADRITASAGEAMGLSVVAFGLKARAAKSTG